ncbi:site-2 protease family protein [Planktothrix sp. FACHB-1355]|uniref:Zinc metalloprotease n=1 Tax=Aerosakkonema funiforme FACHB-1375 TaxID=2949571 RepID=A0A926ZJX3_9CYAN|nr:MULTISPECIES: site-2 protease family protein [Oscillatoriales]MBD2185139.1 site-2 protease family protein [Aerosakkonema funiforme FACHB-1375]MBD3558142.1 site-2 protease family protein [Planktothrix sp. FACHB-1355]
MQAGWRIGSIFGIPLYIDPSWLIILGIFTFANGYNLQEAYPQWKLVTSWGIGFSIAILLFGSVLLHELGHSLVARSQGIKVSSITLFLFGGIASIDRESQTPGLAFQVAIAGPCVSIILFGLLNLLSYLLPPLSPAQVLVAHLANINLVLALFNLIPGLPLDGGQILKAAVWKLKGDRFQGIHWAARTGQILGWVAIIFSGFSYIITSEPGILWMGLLGWFVLRNASAYDQITNLQESLLQLTAADAMTREFRVIDADMTLRQFADDYLLQATQPEVYFAASDGRYRGLVSLDDFRALERSEWETQTVRSIVKPLDAIDTVEEKTPLVEAIERMESDKLSRITVLSPAGTVAGIIDRGDIVRAMAQKLNVKISEAQIKRIKEEGSYPPGLPIPAIAQAAAESTATQTKEPLST